MSDPSPPAQPGTESSKALAEPAATAATAPSLTPQQSPDLRASDAEREHAIEALRGAMAEGRLSVEELEERLRSAYAVRTRRELELLVADVSVGSIVGGSLVATTPAHDSPVVREGPGGTRWVVSILSGDEHRGRWRIAKRCTVLNVMGGGNLDLNDVEFSHPVTQLNVYSVMGGGQIRVPHGVEVQVSKVGFMSGDDVRLGDEVATPGSPVIRVRLVSIMSGSSVRRGRKLGRKARQRERELRQPEHRDELHR